MLMGDVMLQYIRQSELAIKRKCTTFD